MCSMALIPGSSEYFEYWNRIWDKIRKILWKKKETLLQDVLQGERSLSGTGVLNLGRLAASRLGGRADGSNGFRLKATQTRQVIPERPRSDPFILLVMSLREKTGGCCFQGCVRGSF